MAARAALFTLLSADDTLKDLGVPGDDGVWPSYALDVAPRSGYFLIVRFNGTSIRFGSHGPENVTIWCHQSRNEAQDFTGIDAILNRVETILTTSVHVPGFDGTLTQARLLGRSGDLRDPVYDTLTKNSEFEILSR